MLDFPTWKRLWYWGIAVLAMAAAIPSLAGIAGVRWPAALPDPTVNLGLDLAGGSNILLEANREQLNRQRLQTLEEGVVGALRNASPRIRIGDVSTRGGRLSFMLDDAARIDAAREAILPIINGDGMTRDWTLAVVDQSRIVLTPTQSGFDNSLNDAMDSAIEVVRKRIDLLGTREPTILRENEDRIVVQVPGFDDPQALKDLLGETANLEFKLVDLTADPADLARGIAPAGSQAVPFAAGTPQQGQFLAVRRLGGINGDQLTRAQQGFDPQSNAPVINITFNPQGGRRFAELTTQNVGKPFAIILDDEVLSAPNINEPITGGSAQISGNFNVDSANALAIQLRSGALPVELTTIQQGTVGPELGADSIRRGLIAMGIGAGLVLVLMIATYGRFGVYADLALVVNVLMLLGVMAVFGTTLTLPGIAGFVLTIGAAVDANVLINERIREERKRGRRVVQAVDTGYKEASRAIFDANITNVIAASLLFVFGSGPVRGFAVVLMIGIVTSVFTAVTLTRMWVAGWLRRARPSELSI